MCDHGPHNFVPRIHTSVCFILMISAVPVYDDGVYPGYMCPLIYTLIVHRCPSHWHGCLISTTTTRWLNECGTCAHVYPCVFLVVRFLLDIMEMGSASYTDILCVNCPTPCHTPIVCPIPSTANDRCCGIVSLPVCCVGGLCGECIVVHTSSHQHRQ